MVNGAGAAGTAIAKFLMAFGVQDAVVCDRVGILVDGDSRFTSPQQELAKATNPRRLTGTLVDAMKGADVFVGVSAETIPKVV